MKTHNPLHGLLVCYALSMLGSGVAAALFFFYVRDVLVAENHIVTFLALYLIPGVITLPLWKKVALHFGAAPAWLFAMIFTVVVFATVCFLGRGDIIPYGIVCMLTGLTFGAEFMLPAIVLKKVFAVSDEKKNTAYSYATVAFLGKATALVGCAPILLFTGPFNLPADYHHGALILLYGVVPCVVKSAAAYLLWRWLKLQGEGNEKNSTDRSCHAT